MSLNYQIGFWTEVHQDNCQKQKLIASHEMHIIDVACLIRRH